MVGARYFEMQQHVKDPWLLLETVTVPSIGKKEQHFPVLGNCEKALSEHRDIARYLEEWPIKRKFQNYEYLGKGHIISEKYWYHFYCQTQMSYLKLCFLNFPPLDKAFIKIDWLWYTLWDAKPLVTFFFLTQFQNLFFRVVFSTFFGQWKKCIILSEKSDL